MRAETGQTKFACNVVEVYGQAFWGTVEPQFPLLIDRININNCYVQHSAITRNHQFLEETPGRAENCQILPFLTVCPEQVFRDFSATAPAPVYSSMCLHLEGKLPSFWVEHWKQ